MWVIYIKLSCNLQLARQFGNLLAAEADEEVEEEEEDSD